jgi:hypothetical protein
MKEEASGMKMVDLMIAIYGVCGVVAIVAPHGLLDWRLSSAVLLLMYPAHICWTAVIGKRSQGHTAE